MKGRDGAGRRALTRLGLGKGQLAADVLAALALYAALAVGSDSAALAASTSSQDTAWAAQACETVIIKIHAKHWVWVRETRKIHGHRVVVRRHGKIVYLHVHASYLKARPEQVCTATTLAPMTAASPVSPSSLATSAGTAPLTPASQPPVNGGLPTVSGSPQSGQTLTANPGSWSGPPTTYSYQWQRCDSQGASCAAIELATTSSYAVVGADVNGTLRVLVIASDAAGPSSPATSAQTALVTRASPPPSNTALPKISATAKDGQTLSASTGSWTGTPPLSYGYQWQRCDSAGANCVAISLATAPTYKAVPADVGSTLRVAVTASSAAGSSAPALSSPSAIVAPLAPSNTELPKISGTAKDGQALSASTGSWTGTPPLSYGYQWQRCDSAGANCSAISLATGQTYTAISADVGSTLRVSVTASNAAGSSAPAVSSQSAVVGPSGPLNTELPKISGTAKDGQTLSASTGTWSGTPPFSYSYEWQRCDSAGANCAAIPSATSASYVLVHGEVGSTLRVAVTATNAAGSSAPALSSQSAVVVALAPTNTELPKISGTAEDGQTLSASTGGWTGTPLLSYSYEWQRCDSAGANCAAIPFATSATYVLVHGDVGSTLRVAVTASNAPGSTAPATSAQSAVVAPLAPSNLELPKISGTAKDGQALSASTGTWTGTPPLSYSYQWQRCDSAGAKCAAISLATGQTYNAVPADVGSTLRVIVTATNAAGSSAPAVSTQSAVVAPLACGNATLPSISGTATDGQTLSASTGTWCGTPPFSYSYQWQLCDSAGANCAAIPAATSATYVLVHGDVGSSLRVTVTATNAGGEQPATSAQSAVVAPLAPSNTEVPNISGTARDGQTLSASTGAWAGTPTLSYGYQWQRCDSAGANCVAISLATAPTYKAVPADVGSTLRVAVTASNAAGSSGPALSSQTAALTAVQHLEYVFNDGLISVYDMDQGQKLVKTISLPQTKAGVRGVTVAPSTHMLFISYGGDGGLFGSGSVLAYDLVAERVVWTVRLNTGVDSGQVSPDGTRLYMPTGENSSSGIWNILDTSNGAVIGTIQGGASAHNTVVSNDGRYVYLGGREHSALDVYDTATGQVREIGPLLSGVRPFTVNGSNTLAFTTATGFDGFQVSSISTGKVLFTISLGTVPSEFPYTAPSHGTSLSPDEKQLYVIDTVNKDVAVYDVSGVAQGVAPTQLGVIPVSGLTGNENSCAYDCGRSGWLQHSIDGRFVFVGDSGEVIETTTRKVLTTIPTLLNTKNSLEIDWANGVPIATSGRLGVGYVGGSR